jgi:hypothetical protein
MICVINFSILINITNFLPIMRARGAGQLTAVQIIHGYCKEAIWHKYSNLLRLLL